MQFIQTERHGAWVAMVSIVIALSTGLVGCGGGSAKAKKPAQSGSSVPDKQGSPGMVAATDALNRVGNTSSTVVDPGNRMNGEMKDGTGGMNGAGSPQGNSLAATSVEGDSTNTLSASRTGSDRDAAIASPTGQADTSTSATFGGLKVGLKPMGLGKGQSGNGAGGGAGGSSEGGRSLGAKETAATSDSAADNAALAKSAAAGILSGGGGGGGGGDSGGGRSIADLFGGSGDGLGGSGQNSEEFGATADSVSPLGSEDPGDYFTRLGMDDDLFKIVERRYRNKAVVWAKNQLETASIKANAP
ncbi:MAG: hypothetical protein KGQ59_10055 [Bdellovibrionales bacterium]|nr:hypothetical protein [Bdellovibrionales bacterium]